MPNIDTDTLMISLQAVYESVKRYEALLESETLRDPENITELLLSYDEALKVLKSVYREEINKGENLPPLESILVADHN